jgi:hypothetical protein
MGVLMGHETPLRIPLAEFDRQKADQSATTSLNIRYLQSSCDVSCVAQTGLGAFVQASYWR